MPRLVKTNLTSAGQPDLRDRTPSGLPHLRTPHAFLPESQYLSPQIVTHEIKFVPVILFGGVDCHFCSDPESLASGNGEGQIRLLASAGPVTSHPFGNLPALFCTH